MTTGRLGVALGGSGYVEALTFGLATIAVLAGGSLLVGILNSVSGLEVGIGPVVIWCPALRPSVS